MSVPVPAPRSLHNIDNKKPVPTPRKFVSNSLNNKNEEDRESESNFNTFTRRVKTFSSTSKQLTEEFAGKVQEKKKAVIEGTRQSVRKIARRFTTSETEQSIPKRDNELDRKSEADVSDLFNTISFQSPIRSLSYDNANIYNNINESIEYENSDDFRLPPPQHPPPPLREDSIYDQPQSLSESSNSNSSERNCITYNPYEYESIFPLYSYNHEADSSTNFKRTNSWNYHSKSSMTEEPCDNMDSQSVPNISPEIVNTSKHFELRNTLYENHTIKPPPRIKKLSKRAAESVILQFDPLNNVEENYSNINDLKALEELLQGELYGTISNVGTLDDWSTSTDSEIEEYINPPTPPTRFDSLPEAAPTSTLNSIEKSKSNWFVNSSENSKSTTNDSKAMNWLKQVNDVFKKLPSNKIKENTIARATLGAKCVVQQKGMLYKITNGPVEDLFGEFNARWCILENGTFICYSDNTGDTIKENFLMENILSIQALVDQKFKYKYDNEDLHCLEINICARTKTSHVYGSRSISERRIWMQRFAESLTNRFTTKVISDYSRIGWGYIKEGVSGEWTGAWLILSKRTLSYAIDNSPVKNIDLRKARCIILQNYQENEFTPKTNDKGPNMVVDCPGGVLYLRMWTTRETKSWCHVVRLAAHNNGALLEQQQLTKNDVPVIVEKCINFIYANGSMSEGIYRRAGSGATVLDILTKFRRDAWAVQLTSDKYSEHDVATALKRFFRELPEPLLMTTNRQYLYQVSLVKAEEDKIRMFKAVFDNFSTVAQNTIKRVLGHLHFIASQHKRNLMTIDNLAAVWGPTLMCCDENDESQYGQKETAVVIQLISLYRSIFPENPEEVEQERLMLQVLERCLKSPQGPVNTKASGELRVWVYLYNKEGQTFNVAIGPQKTAYEVCLELCSKIKVGVHELQLEEHVLNDNLTRPIHHTEKVLDVVLRWGYWDESDRKDNCLVLSLIAKYWEYIQEKPLPLCGELKYVDNKSKTFKNYMFEFAQAKLSYYKDKTCSVKVNSWNIEDIFWYFGHEPRRNPQSRWTITFILRTEAPKRTKSLPWFGNIIAWNNPGQRASWLAAMLKAEHPQNLTPPPQHVNLMST